MHGPSTKSRDERIHCDQRGQCGSTRTAFGAVAFEMMSREPASPSKKNSGALPVERGCTLGSMGRVLLHELFEVLPLAASPRVKVIRVFSLCPRDLANTLTPNSCQRKCLLELIGMVTQFLGLNIRVDEFLQVKNVDYKGEEVKVGQWFSWSNIHPALPAEIDKVPLEEVCTLGSKHYVQFFDDFLKPASEWRAVRPPRVMVSDSCWGEVCTGLVSSGICVWLEESEVFHLGDTPLLNGMFGVSKEEFTPAGDENFRLIMNLRPLTQ